MEFYTDINHGRNFIHKAALNVKWFTYYREKLLPDAFVDEKQWRNAVRDAMFLSDDLDFIDRPIRDTDEMSHDWVSTP